MTRIGFALLSRVSAPVPSTRIACLNLFPHLQAAGFEPTILFQPESPTEEPDVGSLVANAVDTRTDVVVFQKIHGWSVMRAVQRLREAGIRTVYCVCDLVDDEMADATDATIVVTQFLKSLYRSDLQHKIHVVHDGIERPDVQRALDGTQHPGADRGALRATLVTSHDLYRIPVFDLPPAGWVVEIIGRFPAESSRRHRMRAAIWSLAKIHEPAAKLATVRSMLHPRIRHTAWHPDTVYEHLRRSDVGIIPVDSSERSGPGAPVPAWQVKSENRLTLMMSIGLPVVATPIPAYEAVIDHGINGFFARSPGDWQACLRSLRDPALRASVGARARASVVETFSIERQAALFRGVIVALSPGADF